MTAVTGTTSSDSLTSSTSSTTQKSNDTLGQQDFLQLLTTQLTNQDPFKPMDNADFMGQMAQFSTVSGLQDLLKSFDTLASSLVSEQSLQAANLVGHGVLAEGDVGNLSSSGYMVGAIDLPASTGNAVVKIYNSANQLVQQINLGTQEEGIVKWGWDGTTATGGTAAAGNYKITAEMTGTDGKKSAVPTLTTGVVQSVSLGSGSPVLNLSGAGSVDFSSVREIY